MKVDEKRAVLPRPSRPALCRASTSFLRLGLKTWMAGTSPAMTKVKVKVLVLIANAPPPHLSEREHPFPFSSSLSSRGMERREAPGRGATAPLHAPCDRGAYAPCGQACETCPEARAS